MTSSVASVSRLCQLLWLPVVFVVWFASNVAINLYNKWVLAKTDFHFPLTLSCTNKTVGWLGSLVVLKVAAMCGTASLPSLDSLLSQFKRPLVHAHGVTTAINIGLNNWSLVLISITLNQLIRSTVPLPTAVLSTLLEGRRYSAHVYASMCIVVLGVVLASSGALEASPLGLVLASLSVLSAATWGVLSGLLLQRPGAEKLDAIGLVFVSSPTSIATLGLLALVLEAPQLREWLAGSSSASHLSLNSVDAADGADGHAANALALLIGGGPPLGANATDGGGGGGGASNNGLMAVAYLACGGLLGFWYDLVHNSFLKLTSSVTMAVMGNAKLVVLIGISMAAFENGTPTALQGVGVLLGVAGCIYYSIHVHLERQGEREAREAREADAAMKEAEDGKRVGAAKPQAASENTTLLGGQRK